MHVDHIIPLSRGGPHDISNVRIIPATFNLRKNAKMDHEVGHLIPSCWLERKVA